MDSLTARLMSRSGLSPADPTLPPVQNMRVVNLKEEFGAAEIALHEARVALKNLEDSSGTEAALYTAMAKLEVRERDYFATRYFGRNKAVLKGWNVDRKQEIFDSYISVYLSGKMRAKTLQLRRSRMDPSAAVALTAFKDVLAALQRMHRAWYRYGTVLPNNRKTDTPDFSTNPRDIKTKIGEIQTSLGGILNLPDTDPSKQRSIRFTRETLRDALICQRLAHLVTKNSWDLPDDLRKPPPSAP